MGKTYYHYKVHSMGWSTFPADRVNDVNWTTRIENAEQALKALRSVPGIDLTGQTLRLRPEFIGEVQHGFGEGEGISQEEFERLTAKDRKS